MKINRPTLPNQKKYFTEYVNQAESDYLIDSLRISEEKTLQLMKLLNAEDLTVRYQKEKWAIAQVFRHINDCERILASRVLRISRKDQQDLPGFDQDRFATLDYSANLTLEELQQDYQAVRASTNSLLQLMDPKAIDFEGNCNGTRFSNRIVAWMIPGHNMHHLNILHELYVPLLG